MDTRNTDRTNMIRTVTSYADDHAADTAAITDYAPTVTAVKNKLVLIDALDIVSSGTSKGVTLDANALRRVMETDTTKLCGGLKALAGATNNNEMFVAADYTEAKLAHLPKDKTDDICEGIQQLAAANAAALVPKGIVASDITDTLTAVNLYRLSQSNTRNKIIEIKNAGDKIEPIIRDIIDNLLHRQLDQLTNTLKVSNNTYFTGYYLAREIVNTGASSTRVKGTVTVKDSNPIKPVFPAQIKLSGVLGNGYIIPTDLNGNILEKIKPDTYQGEAIAAGFDNYIIAPFAVGLGKTVTLDIQMTLTV